MILRLLVQSKRIKHKQWLKEVFRGNLSFLYLLSSNVGRSQLPTRNAIFTKPAQMNEYVGEGYDQPSVEIFYKVQTMPATYTDIRYWSENQTVYVQWSVANEKDVDQYFLLKLNKSGEYVKIDSVRAANTGSLTHYVGFDRNPDPETSTW